MCEKLTLFIVLFLLFVDNISPSENFTACYFDGRYQAPPKIGDLTDNNCSPTDLTEKVRKENISECDPSKDAEGYPLFDPAINNEKFLLSVDVGPSLSRDNQSQNDTILIVSISNITFRNLTIQLQNLAQSNQKMILQTIWFEENKIPGKINLFFNMCSMEYHRTKIQFFARSGKELKFYKEYHSIIPGAIDIGNHEEIVANRVFGYVDTTWRHRVILHIQSLPKEFNITGYDVRFMNEQQDELDRFNLSEAKLEYEESDFPKADSYSFSITPIDANEKNHISSRSAVFCMKKTGPPLIIMIVSMVTIPFVAFFVLYTLYNTVYKKKVIQCLKGRKLKVLLVYSATNDFHVAVVVMLAQYLRSCDGITVMFDKSDVSLTVHENPGYWLDVAFGEADIIIVIASPPPTKCVVRSTAHIGLDQRAYTLIHENRKNPHKKYLGLLLPYCNTFEKIVDPCLSKRLELPKDRKKLLNKIHGFKYTDLSPAPDERQLIEIIELATRSIRNGKAIEISKSVENLLGLKSPDLPEVTIDVDEEDEVDLMWEDSRANDSENHYTTDIRTLNL